MTILDSYQKGLGVMDAYRKNRMLKNEAAVHPELLKAKNDLAKAQAGIAGNTLEFAPSMSQEELKKLQLENQFYPESTQANNAYKLGMISHMGSPGYIFNRLPSVTKEQLIELAQEKGEFPSIYSNYLGALTGNNQSKGGGIAGNSPGTATATIAPEKIKELIGQTQAALQKTTSDANTRKRAQYAINIDKTIATIDESPITYYSGPDGAAKLKIDQARSIAGNPTPEYESYNNFVKVQVPALVQQVRQFYGTSIQPEVQKELNQLINPIHWYTNPKIAQAQFGQFKNLMSRETSTYLDTLNAPIKAPTQEELKSYSTANQNSKDMVSVISPQGVRGTIPNDKVDAALKQGFKVQ